MSLVVNLRVPAHVRPFIFGRFAIAALTLLTLQACSSGSMSPGGGSDALSSSTVGPSGGSAQSRSDQETRAACRQRVNEMFEKRNRGEIYAANPSVNSPESANYLGGLPNRGLSAQFDYERTIDDCVRSSGTGTSSIIAPTPASAAPARKNR
jgi:hypothetical protein